jgi:predicted homoserine dehydrogenase-like protein
MMLFNDLEKLEAEGSPIRIGVSGAGWIGSGFVHQISLLKGMRVDVLADQDTKAAFQTFINSGISPEDIVETDNPGKASDAISASKKVISGSYKLTSQIETIDIVADVTPYPSTGAETANACIKNGKDIVMVNIEADVTVGRILKKQADLANILYTVSSGDEPGCLMELYDFVKSLGYEIITIGKGKNNPLNPSATPDDVADSARNANKDPFTVASYVDGTKTMFEMTCAANATGCIPMQRGMTGPEADLNSISKIFALKEDGGISECSGIVDFVQGSAMAGGVFVTVRIEDERIRDDLQYLKVGKGKYFTFFRPYHLWFLEAPISVARAVLYRQRTLVPLEYPVAESMAIAKRDLNHGEILDDFGGYTFYGSIEKADTARDLNALPVGLAPNAKMINPIKKGEIITWDHVQLDENQTVVKLRREQDNLK